MKNNQLSPAIAAHFELRLLHPGKHILDTRYGGLEVDFRTITLARAQELASLPGFPYLVKRKAEQGHTERSRSAYRHRKPVRVILSAQGHPDYHRVTLSAVEVPSLKTKISPVPQGLFFLHTFATRTTILPLHAIKTCRGCTERCAVLQQYCCPQNKPRFLYGTASRRHPQKRKLRHPNR